jgi:hypothetical protein
MCFGSKPKAPPPPPPPADLAPEAPTIGQGETDTNRGQYNRKKKGTSSLQIQPQVGGTTTTGTNIPTK